MSSASTLDTTRSLKRKFRPRPRHLGVVASTFCGGARSRLTDTAQSRTRPTPRRPFSTGSMRNAKPPRGFEPPLGLALSGRSKRGKKDGPVGCCTGPVAAAYDAQSTVAVCGRSDGHVVNVAFTVAEAIRGGFRRGPHVALTPPTFALKLGDGVDDFVDGAPLPAPRPGYVRFRT